MRRHNAFIIKFLKDYEAQCPTILDDWCSKDIQDQFQKIRYLKENRKKRRCSSYILFCIQKRPELRALNPYLPNTRITSMIAKEWREHRDNNDEVYLEFKRADDRQVFLAKHRIEISDRYPHLSERDVNLTLEKMYERYAAGTAGATGLQSDHKSNP